MKNSVSAKRSRKKPSVAEQIAWRYLRNSRLGFKFRREQPALDYRLDFYCAEAKLGVEFDGEQHDLAKDAIRDKRLAEIGIQILRIPNERLFTNEGTPSADIFNEILTACESRSGRNGTPFEL